MPRHKLEYHPENLPQNRLTGEEKSQYYRDIQKKGVEARRVRKTFKETCQLIASTAIRNPEDIVPNYVLRTADSMGLDTLTYRDAVVIATFLKGMNGDGKSFELIRDTLGEDPAKAPEEEDNSIPKAKAFADFVVKTTHRVLTEKVGAERAEEVMLEVFRLYREKVKELDNDNE